MKAFLLTIGDELLIGQTVNTNAAWLGEQLSLLGIDVVGAATVRDDAPAILRALAGAFEQATLVVTTGGLGPTHDDLTRDAVADYFGVDLVVDDALLRRIEDYYARRDRTVPEAVRVLAEVPEGFDVLDNPFGTAPGLQYTDDAGRHLVILPGVPSEMKGIVEATVLPRLRRRDDLGTVVHRTLLTTGLPESSLQEKIRPLVKAAAPSLGLAYLPSTSGVRLRLTAHADARAEAERQLDRFEADLRERIDRYIFGTGNDLLEAVVGCLLKERALTVAVAESATGGLLMSRLTDVPGASAYVRGGIVAYADAVKTDVLGVYRAPVAAGGAVSEEVARQMARGVRAQAGADVGLSTTGIAGPTGGSHDKPVGTLWVGLSSATGDEARRYQFTDDRRLNKELFSTAALEVLRRQLLRHDVQPA